MAHKRGDYSDFIIGEIYPNRRIKIMSSVFKGKDNRPSVLFTCVECNSGILYEGRVDNIRKGHTWRCAECGRRKRGTKPKEIDYKRNSHSIKETINKNNLKSNHCGEIRGNWLIQEYHHSDLQGHSYYTCLNIKTGITKEKRLDNLPHTINSRLTNISNGTIPENNTINNKESKGERLVRIWLTEHNIEFEQEYPFDDLHGVNNGHLRFDFKIKNKPILIEFQGEEHYFPIDFFGGEEGFKIRQIHDNLKRIYCKKHHYKLIEIPYNYKTLDEYLTKI